MRRPCRRQFFLTPSPNLVIGASLPSTFCRRTADRLLQSIFQLTMRSALDEMIFYQ
jgi:hypothetical protein